MPRILSATIQAVLDAQYAEVHDVVEITVKDTPPALDDVLYLAGVPLTIGAQAYEPLLSGIDSIKFSKGKAPDNAGFTIINVDGVYAGLLTQTDRSLTGSTAVIKRAFLVDEDPRTFETDTIFIGVIKDWRIDQESIKVTLISDMSTRGAMVAARPLTQRCIWVFKSVECGYVDGQGGTTDIQVPGQPVGVTMFDFCDKVFDSAGGCLGHLNQWRFGGVPPLSPTVRAVTGDDDVPDFGGYEPPDTRYDSDWNRQLNRIP